MTLHVALFCKWIYGPLLKTRPLCQNQIIIAKLAAGSQRLCKGPTCDDRRFGLCRTGFHTADQWKIIEYNWIKLCPTKIVSKSSYTFCCTQFGFGWSIYVGYPTLQVYSQRNSQRGCPIFRPTLHRPDFPDSSLDESNFCLGKMSRSEAPKGRKYQADWCNVVKPKT